jgi:hypothetical protein
MYRRSLPTICCSLGGWILRGLRCARVVGVRSATSARAEECPLRRFQLGQRGRSFSRLCNLKRRESSTTTATENRPRGELHHLGIARVSSCSHIGWPQFKTLHFVL